MNGRKDVCILYSLEKVNEMNVNDLIDCIDDIQFLNEKNKFNISMIYYSGKKSWNEASAELIKKNKNLLCGYTDWRLPTIDEMKYICKTKILRNIFLKGESYGESYEAIDSLLYEWILCDSPKSHHIANDRAAVVFGYDGDDSVVRKYDKMGVIYIR